MTLVLHNTVNNLEQSLIGISQGAKRLGVSPTTIRRAIKDGDIACVRIRRRMLIPVRELERIERGKLKASLAKDKI